MEPGIHYLLEASVKLECSRSTKIRAMILYHQFMRCVDDVKYDVAMVAAAALNLSSKVSEEPINLDTLVLLFYCIVNKTNEVLDSDDVPFVSLRKSFTTVDFIMQRMLEYTLNHQLAHQYLLPFLEMIYARSAKIAGYHQAVNETCLALMSDFYTNRQCLNFKPDHIAVACIDAALHIYELEKDIEITKPWYEVLCSDLTRVRLKEIKYDIFRLYKLNEPQFTLTEPQPKIPEPQHKIPEAQHIIPETQHKIPEPQPKISEPQPKISEPQPNAHDSEFTEFKAPPADESKGDDDDIIVEEVLPIRKVIEEIVLD